MDELKIAESLAKLFQIAGWELIACVICPYIAFRITQTFKRWWRKAHKHRPPSFVLHTFTFTIAWLLSSYALLQKYPQVGAVIFLGFILAVLNSSIVEFIFRKSEKSEALSSALKADLYVEEKTLLTTTLGLATGAKVYVSKRDDDDTTGPRDAVWTDEQRAKFNASKSG
jgi:hypothetical protein